MGENLCWFENAIEGNLNHLQLLLSPSSTTDISSNPQEEININQQDEQNGYTALMYAVEENHLEYVQYLIQHWASLTIRSDTGLTAFLCAATTGNHEILLYLIQQGASLEDYNNKGQSALLLATIGGHVDCVAVLIAKGLSLNHADNYGDTALIKACQLNHFDIITMLIHLGANLNLQNENGRTALMICCEKSFTLPATLLISHGADLDITTPIRRYTALMYAAQAGQDSIVKLLLDSGVKTEIKNVDGLTALDMSANQTIWNYLSPVSPSGSCVLS